jgi:hypothetical protein
LQATSQAYRCYESFGSYESVGSLAGYTAGISLPSYESHESCDSFGSLAGYTAGISLLSDSVMAL